eukprot:COSAG06_NODE_174_length_21223_cov_8.836158_7_plen_63_part_00
MMTQRIMTAWNSRCFTDLQGSCARTVQAEGVPLTSQSLFLDTIDVCGSLMPTRNISGQARIR